MKDRMWIEKIFDKIPVHYTIVSVIIASIIYLTFILFSKKVVFFPLEFFHHMELSALSFLIAFQLVGIQYLLIEMKKIFDNLTKSADFNRKLKQRFYNSRLYYVIISSVIFPFIIIDMIEILQGGVTFYIVEPTVWSFLLDIYSYITSFLMILLLATILWIIIYISWVLNELGNDPYQDLIKFDIFSIDRIGGLKPLRSLILNTLVVYFVSITLAIIAYISPFSIFTYESFFLITLLLVGVGFFLMGVGTIRKISRGRIENKIKIINEKYEIEDQKLMNFIPEGDCKEKLDELNLLSSTLETLYTERDRILQIHGNAKGYDIITIVQFISSFILPLIAYLQKIFHFSIKTIL